MATYDIRGTIGQDAEVEYSARTVGLALVGMRVVMGWTLFQGGLTKILAPWLTGETWTAAGYLQSAIHEENVLRGFFAAMAGSPVIDFLVMWGMMLTGLGLILGALVRWNAFWGAFMMLMLWLSALQGGFLGLAVEHGWLVDEHIVYAILLFGLGAFGAGRYYGLDAYIEEMNVVDNKPWLKYLLG